MIFFANRVLTVTHSTYRTGKGHAVNLIYWYCWSHFQSILHRCTIHLFRIGKGEVLTHGNHLVQIVWGIHTCRDVLEICIFQDTIILLVTQGEHSWMFLIGMRKRYIIIAGKTCSWYFIHPISIWKAHGFLAVDEAVIASIDCIVHIFWLCRIPYGDRSSIGCIDVKAIVLGIDCRIKAIVEGCLHHCRSILARVAKLHLGLVGIELCREVGWEVYLYLVTFLSLLGRNDDYTISRAWSIDRSWGCIFQHLHAFNVTGIEWIQGRIRRHTIYNVEWILWSVKRTNTAYSHSSCSTWWAIDRNVHARNLTLKRTHRVCVRWSLERIGWNYGYRTRQIGFSLRCVACHYDLVQQFWFFFQCDFQIWSCFNLLADIADVRDNKEWTLLSFQFEITVNVSDNTVRCAFFNHRGTDNRFAISIDNSSQTFCLRK